ncbi:MAG TPA: phosphodiester glycosidase family protein, partial [Candidatus Eisenbacteria bacterium]
MSAARHSLALALVFLLAAGVGGVFAPAAAVAAEPATVSIWRAGAWHEWWRDDRAPERWDAADTSFTGAFEWQHLAPGLDWASARLACPAPAWRARLIVARIDPRVVALSLEMDLTPDQHPRWTIDRAPREALLAVNAGQFVGAMPWGWVAIDGRQLLRPGYGPLASAVTIDDAGRVRWSHGDSTMTPNGAKLGFQSYPTLLSGDGAVPRALRTGEGGVNLRHRDARLAIGETRDGRLLIVLTRFDAMGEIMSSVPLGPTTPEMAAIMGALGARDAVMLDGGISAQLLLRGAPGA